MKKIKQIVTFIFCLMACVIIVTSCDDMNDIQSQYADREETVYVGKVDSVKFFPGNEKVKITWYVSADPKISKTIVYWNMRNDSIVKEYNRTAAGVQKDSIIINNLPEGSTLFEFRNISKDGKSSLFSKAAATVWGAQYADRLYSRKIVSQDFDYEGSAFKLGFSPVFNGDSVVYSQIVYTDMQSEQKILRIERATTSVTLPDFKDGSEVQFRTAFFPPHGIDTIFNNYQVYKAPTVVFDNGEKISIKGNLASRYFEREGSLYEWNAAGDIIVYTLDESGSFTLSKTYPSLVPRTKYREFFFHDDDKFIGIGVDHRVFMLQLTEGVLKIVKTPAGAEFMSSGYNMPTFIPSKGYFYSVYANGDLKTFFPNNNATWGSPNIVIEATKFTYTSINVFSYKYIIGVDANGYLFSYPISTIGKLSYKSTIGSGWGKFKKIVSVGEKLLCMDANADFYLFEFNTTDNYWVLN